MSQDVEVSESSTELETVSLESLTAEQDQHWRLTGELPAKEADSPTAKTTDEASEQSEPPKGTQETGKGKGVKQRTTQLDSEIQELEARLHRKAELKRQLASEEGEKKAPPAETKPSELKPPVKPKVDDFDTFEKYDEAKDKYYEDLAEYKATVKLTEFETKQRENAAKERAVAENKVVADRFNKQISDMSKKVGVEEWNAAAEAVAAYTNPEAHPSFNAASGFLLESENSAEVMYYLGTHLEELAEIDKMSPIKQVRALTLIEAQLTGTPTKEPKKAPPGPKKVSEAPPPPTELGARNAIPADPVEAALESGDTEAYIAAMNAKDLASGRRAFQR